MPHPVRLNTIGWRPLQQWRRAFRIHMLHKLLNGSLLSAAMRVSKRSGQPEPLHGRTAWHWESLLPTSVTTPCPFATRPAEFTYGVPGTFQAICTRCLSRLDVRVTIPSLLFPLHDTITTFLCSNLLLLFLPSWSSPRSCLLVAATSRSFFLSSIHSLRSAHLFSLPLSFA